MKAGFRAAMSALAFASGIAAPAAYAQLVPNPTDIASVGVGSITARPPDGQTLVAVNVGQVPRNEGDVATVAAFGTPAVADVAVGNVTTPERTQAADVIGIGVGSTEVTAPNDRGSVVTLAIAQANPPQGHTASIGIASGGTPASVALPGWTGIPGVSTLPFSLPRPGGR